MGNSMTCCSVRTGKGTGIDRSFGARKAVKDDWTQRKRSHLARGEEPNPYRSDADERASGATKPPREHAVRERVAGTEHSGGPSRTQSSHSSAHGSPRSGSSRASPPSSSYRTDPFAKRPERVVGAGGGPTGAGGPMAAPDSIPNPMEWLGMLGGVSIKFGGGTAAASCSDCAVAVTVQGPCSGCDCAGTVQWLCSGWGCSDCAVTVQ